MIVFTTTIKKFAKMGEKTGWSYIEVSEAQANKLKPNTKVSFRVKGSIDQHPIEKTAMLPMGDGAFIIPMNATMRKATGKKAGDKIKVQLELDERKLILSPDLIKCLKDEPEAFAFFKKLPMSHQQYYSKWIEGAKTMQTKSKRIAATVMGCANKQKYNEMMRSYKNVAE